MHSAIGDAALTIISRKTNYFHGFVQYPLKKRLLFPSFAYALSMFSNFGHFSALRSYKRRIYTNGFSNGKGFNAYKD